MNYSHASYVSKDFSNLLENPVGYNVKIKIVQASYIKEFRAHSVILSSRSKCFLKAFSKHSTTYEDGVITFTKPNISPEVFEVLLKYVYTGFLSINNNISLVDVIFAAEEMGLSKVIQQLEEHLIQNETAWKLPNDFIPIFQNDRFPKLSNYAIEAICKNPKKIFESNYFLQMKEATLIQLLKRNDLKLEEIEIWEYLVKWGIKNTDSTLDNDLTKWRPLDFMELEKTIRNCVPHVRFFHMSSDDYTQIRNQFGGVIPDKLDGEIIHYFFNPKSSHSFNGLPLRESAYHLDSKIIETKDVALIASWIKKKAKTYRLKDIPFKFELIYRASREGFSVNDFHKKCDRKGPTVTIIKIRNSGEIIGGYNPLSWRSTKTCDESDESSRRFFYNKYNTSDSFIFSLTNRAMPILSRVFSENEAIICNSNGGPCFGLEDLRIDYDDSSFNNIVGKSKRCSYEKKIINRETFEIEEYEVYQISKTRPYLCLMVNLFKGTYNTTYTIFWVSLFIFYLFLNFM